MERELLLLGILRRGDMHGYQLHEFINTNMEYCIDLKKPTAYALLDKMAGKGWIVEEKEQVGNRPLRSVYSLPPAGEAMFQKLLRQNLASFAPTRFGSDIGLVFIDSLPAEEAITLLAQRRTAMVAELNKLAVIPPHEGGSGWLIEHQVRHLQTEVAWLDEVIGRLRA